MNLRLIFGRLEPAPRIDLVSCSGFGSMVTSGTPNSGLTGSGFVESIVWIWD